MHIRFLLSASAALAIATAVTAEPAKPVSRDSVQPAPRPAEIILASAEQAQAPAPAASQEAPSTPVKRPRAARVTTCRCGGQTQN